MAFTLMPTFENSEEDFRRVEAVFLGLTQRPVSESNAKSAENKLPLRLKPIMSIRDAMLSPSELIDAKDSYLRVCAEPAISCPPAIPIAVSGELISHGAIELFQKYGIEKIRVVKKREVN